MKLDTKMSSLRGGPKVRRSNPFLSEDRLPCLFQRLAMTTFWYLTLNLPNLLASPSLFFTQDEINIIRKIENTDTLMRQSLHLSSLLYIDHSHWVFWINGKCFRPETATREEELKIIEVTEHHVKIRVKDYSKTVTLWPGRIIKFQKIN